MVLYIKYAGKAGALGIFNLDTRSRLPAWRSGHLSLQKILPLFDRRVIWFQSRSGRGVGHKILCFLAGKRTQVVKPVATVILPIIDGHSFYFLRSGQVTATEITNVVYGGSPGVCSLNANFSERSVCSVFMGESVRTLRKQLSFIEFRCILLNSLEIVKSRK
jgi:hypothetical protein